MSERVIAVVVTYNRRALLLEALDALAAQSRPVDQVVVVDNASEDGTAGAVRSRFADVDLHRLPANTGGAGGFAYGIDAALAAGADLVWLMDDDTVPEPGALAELLAARRRYAGSPPVVLASRVVWTDGRAHPMNTPRPKPFAPTAERRAAASVGCVPIRSASFVSVLVDAAACRRHELPVAEYFLWNDDFEYTARLLRAGVGLLCPASVAVHKTARFAAAHTDPGERFFFEVRNKVWLLTRSPAFTPAERPVYAAATARRWARTIARADARGPLFHALVRGIGAGLRRGPRPNAEVLPAAARLRRR